MEFSKKENSKSHSNRRNPYATGGKSYLSRVLTKGGPHTTPSRKHCQPFAYKSQSSKPKSCSRSHHILQNSSNSNYSSKTSPPQWISKKHDKNTQPPVRPTNKRLFQSVEGSYDELIDQFRVLSDDENDDIFLSAKHDKLQSRGTNKENELNKPKLGSLSAPRVYNSSVNKKVKSLNIRNSQLLHDIPIEKVNNSFEYDKGSFYKSDNTNIKNYKFKSFIDKENGKSDQDQLVPSASNAEHPHLVGFPNFGNTCYLNAVLQTIVSLQPFIVDLHSAMNTLNVPSTSVVHSLWNIIIGRQKLDCPSIKTSLRAIKENVEKVDGSFSGFKMQDANEFLTQVLDTVKNEVDKLSVVQKGKSESNDCVTPENIPSLIEPSSIDKRLPVVSSNIESPKELDKTRSIFNTPSSSSPLSLEIGGSEIEFLDEVDNIFLTPKQKQNSNSQRKLLKPLCNNGNDNQEDIVNPVQNNFEFELFETYTCLGCGESEGRRQKHFALYVNLPAEEQESIQKAVEVYMGEDHRELTCKSCQHKKAAFFTSFVQLPRVLIVQVKRYEYKAEQAECIKVSSKVDVNMWLHLDKLTSENFSPPPPFKKKSISFSSKETVLKTLSVRNLSSEMNICSQAKEEALPSITSPASQDETARERDTKAQEEKELQEVLIRSMNDIGGDESSKSVAEPDKEEEEFQKAIKLSLQDMGMYYSHHSESDDDECQVQTKKSQEERGDGKDSYHLASIISHFGLTTCTGHYVSDVLNMEENRWFHYDDESVSNLPESVLLSDGRQKNGYIFFYVHQDIYNELRKNEMTGG